jgi:uncharacterized membrane protein SpoIIM required for sporulation
VDLDAYVAEHAGEWRRLEELSKRRKLAAEEVDELVALYQRAATHLSVVRSRSPDPALVARLSRLVLGGRNAVAGASGFSWRTVGRFFTRTFPLAAYRAWPWWAGVSCTFTALSFGLMWYVASHPDVALLFLSQSDIDDLVNHDFASYYSEYQPQNFSFNVWTHNAFVTALCLVAGVLVVPVLYVLLQNLLNIGLIGGIMISAGRSSTFFGLIMPHGLLELTCVFFAAGVGLRIGWSWISPGRHRTRGRALGEAFREGVTVALGLACVLGVSGLLEGFLTPSPLPGPVKVILGAMVWLAFLGYIVVFGRRAADLGHVADLDESLGEATVPMA